MHLSFCTSTVRHPDDKTTHDIFLPLLFPSHSAPRTLLHSCIPRGITLIYADTIFIRTDRCVGSFARLTILFRAATKKTDYSISLFLLHSCFCSFFILLALSSFNTCHPLIGIKIQHCSGHAFDSREGACLQDSLSARN